MKFKTLLSYAAIFALIMAVSCVDSDVNLQKSTSETYVANQILVKFKSGATGARTSSALALIGGEVAETISTEAMKSESARKGVSMGSLMLVNTKMNTESAIERLKASPEVEYAEPNFIYQHFATSNDTYYTNGSLWGMYGDATSPANQYGSQAGEAWAAEHTGSSTVWVGIIDEGYMHTHEDLAANAGTNPREVAGNGVLMTSLLVHGCCNPLGQRVQQIGQHGTLTGSQNNLNRHARQHLAFAELFQALGRHHNARKVVSHAILRVGQQVTRHRHQLAFNHQLR